MTNRDRPELFIRVVLLGAGILFGALCTMIRWHKPVEVPQGTFDINNYPFQKGRIRYDSSTRDMINISVDLNPDTIIVNNIDSGKLVGTTGAPFPKPKPMPSAIYIPIGNVKLLSYDFIDLRKPICELKASLDTVISGSDTTIYYIISQR